MTARGRALRPTDGRDDSCNSATVAVLPQLSQLQLLVPIGAHHARMRGTTPEQLTKGAARRAGGAAECESQRSTRDDALEEYATTTIINHDTRRTTAATRCEEPVVPGRVAATRQESAGERGDRVPRSLRPTHEKGPMHIGAAAAGPALVPQRWTMLLVLMLACAELFMPGLLLLQLGKAWVITVNSTHSRHTACARVVCICADSHACRQAPVGK